MSATGRSTARLDDETVTAGRLGLATGPLVEIHGQHDQQRLLDADWQRDLLDAFGGHGETRALVADAVERWRANRAALAALAIDPRELLRRQELLEHEAAEIAAGGLRPGEAAEITAQLAAAQHAETIASGARDVREVLLGEGTRRPGAARTGGAGAAGDRTPRSAAGRASPSGSSGSRPRSRTSPPRSGSSRRRSTTTRHRSRRSRTGWARSTGSCAATATTRPTVIAHGERAAAEAERLRGLEGERGMRAAEDGRLLLEVADAAASLSILRARTASGLGNGGLGGARGARVPGGRVRGRARATTGGQGRPGGRGRRRRRRLRRERHRHGRVPVPAQRRRARPAAGAHRVGRRAVARRARDQAGPRRGGRDADARVRRDRHGHRRAERRPGRAEPVDARPRAPGPVRHAPAADRGVRRRALPDRQARARRTDGDGDHAPRSRRAASASSPR